MATQRTGPYEPARPESLMPGRAQAAARTRQGLEAENERLRAEMRRIAIAIDGKLPGCTSIPARIRSLLNDNR